MSSMGQQERGAPSRKRILRTRLTDVSGGWATLLGAWISSAHDLNRVPDHHTCRVRLRIGVAWLPSNFHVASCVVGALLITRVGPLVVRHAIFRTPGPVYETRKRSGHTFGPTYVFRSDPQVLDRSYLLHEPVVCASPPACDTPVVSSILCKARSLAAENNRFSDDHCCSDARGSEITRRVLGIDSNPRLYDQGKPYSM
jgi:hypothetical protein